MPITQLAPDPCPGQGPDPCPGQGSGQGSGANCVIYKIAQLGNTRKKFVSMVLLFLSMLMAVHADISKVPFE